MSVTPVPGEIGRYWVESSSRPGMQHLVDMLYIPEGMIKPRAVCSCEHSQIRGATCKHIASVVDYIQTPHEATKAN